MARRIVCALDIGSYKISVVIAAVDDGTKKPTVLGVYSQPSKGIKKGVIVNIDEATNVIAQVLTAAERMAGVTVPSCYVTINGKNLQSVNNKGVIAISNSKNDIGFDDVLRSIESAKTIPLSSDREIIHVISREFIVDSQGGIKYPIGMSGSRLEVDTHIITVPSTNVQNITKCVQNIGLSIDGVVFTGLASAYSVLTDTEKELGVLLLDIGAGTVSITMYIDGSIAFSGVIPLGSMHVTSDLAAGLQISFEDAEKLKRRYKELVTDMDEIKINNIDSEEIDNKPALVRKQEAEKNGKPEEKDDPDKLDLSLIGINKSEEVSKQLCDDIIAARCEEILELSKKHVESSNIEVTIPSGIVVTGGGAKIPGILDYVKKVFGVNARIGKPQGLTGMIEEIKDVEYAAVQGLVLYAVEDEVDLGNAGRTKRSFNTGGLINKVKDFFKGLFPGN